MRRLWTPWRSQYIQGPRLENVCVFCKAARQGKLVVHRDAHAFILLNRFPYTSGHVMIAPYQHVARLSQVEDIVVEEMMRLARRMEAILEKLYNPDGLNMGMNLGQAAGAGIEQHIHMHILPRWNGDANFMTTVADTRILPETLDDTHFRIMQALGEKA